MSSMKPLLPAWTFWTVALVLAVAAPAAAGGQRHAPAGSGSTPAPAVPRSAPPPAPPPAPAAPAPASNTGRDSGRDQERATSRGGGNTGHAGSPGNNVKSNDSPASGDNGSTSAGRRRGNLPRTGDAVARTSPPRPPDGDHNGGGQGVLGGTYPWWSSGYYAGYYAYDPWVGWYPTYDTAGAGGGDSEGALRLKVKPVEASVYVDGYYVGVVDDFDGVFQRLRLEPGAHHIEIQAPALEPLSFDVLIQPGHTTTYRGELVR
jgi:hypothetical protein